jgi:ABC-type nitrate/sulfonate/bicarbonate transport system permease component
MTAVAARSPRSSLDDAAIERRERGRGWPDVMRAAVAAADPLRLAGLVLLVGVWQLLAFLLPPIILPSPAGVAGRAYADFLSAPSLAYYGLSDASLYGNMLYTGENVLIAIVVGAGLGIVGGLMSARLPLFRAVVDPVMLTAGIIPMLVAAPFLLIWFGVGRASAVCLVIFYVTAILYLFAQRAADNLDPIYEDSAKTLGATPRQIIRDLLIPGTVPEILGGLRIALAGAWGLEAIAELLGSQQGMGKVLEVLAGATDPQGIMATLLVLGLTAVIADAVAAFAIARLTSWNAPARARRGER